MRKPARSVDLDDIISSQIIGDNPELIALTLKIHLALEVILIEMLRLTDATENVYRHPFPSKTSALVKSGAISAADKAAFDLFNDFRNDFAHIFAHSVSLTEVLALARSLQNNGVDFSDSAGHYNEEEATECYGGALGILEEIGSCILFHAAYLLSKSGGRNIFDATN